MTTTTKKYRTLTLAQLQNAKACQSQRDLFHEMFDESVKVTIELASDHAQKFNCFWAAEHFLRPEGFTRFNAIVARADRKRLRAVKDARGELCRVPTHINATILRQHEQTIARAFARLYIAEGGDS